MYEFLRFKCPILVDLPLTKENKTSPSIIFSFLITSMKCLNYFLIYCKAFFGILEFLY